eukprot:scaffold10650_cov85-Skeletonema_dohrnii-CCMP3373.AAC.2
MLANELDKDLAELHGGGCVLAASCWLLGLRYGFVHQDTGRQTWPFTIVSLLAKMKDRLVKKHQTHETVRSTELNRAAVV